MRNISERSREGSHRAKDSVDTGISAAAPVITTELNKGKGLIERCNWDLNVYPNKFMAASMKASRNMYALIVPLKRCYNDVELVQNANQEANEWFVAQLVDE
ncbi:hypothetical protein HID58_047976 [Brassica napus]|uniref:Uncharacterized protein n=1 Tax=Brassica napus TaxID=3708 RepID=A0ABQ8B149_BRANA|nr:hypothetical protein HID58_047976 [Brassica napus]